MPKKKKLQYKYWTKDRALYEQMKRTATGLGIPLGTVVEVALRAWLRTPPVKVGEAQITELHERGFVRPYFYEAQGSTPPPAHVFHLRRTA